MKVLSFILLLISSNCFLVYEKIPLNTYIGKVREELKEILSLRFFENIKYDDYSDTIDNIQYTLSQVKPISVHFNSYMLSPTINPSPNLIISLDWSTQATSNFISPYHLIYTAYVSSNDQKYQIQFEIETSQFSFKKYWEYYEQDQFYIPNGEISNIYTSFKVKCLDTKCPYNTELLLNIINGFIASNQQMMNNVFSNGVDSYYKSLPFEEYEQKIYTRTASSISNENNLDLSIEDAPEYRQVGDNNGIFIFKRKGTLNGEEIQQESPIDYETINQSFNIDKRIYQKLVSENNMFDITYEKTTNPSYKYELTIENLKKVANIKDTYPESIELKVEAKMNDINLDSSNPLKGIVTFDVNIISREDLSTVFAFTLKLEFTFIINLFQNGLNCVLVGKNLIINDIQSEAEIIDMNILKDWIVDTYLCALGNTEFKLLTLALDLNYYFKGNALRTEYNGNYLSVIKN